MKLTGLQGAQSLVNGRDAVHARLPVEWRVLQELESKRGHLAKDPHGLSLALTTILAILELKMDWVSQGPVLMWQAGPRGVFRQLLLVIRWVSPCARPMFEISPQQM